MDMSRMLSFNQESSKAKLPRTPLRPFTLKLRFEGRHNIDRSTVVQLIESQFGHSAIKGVYNKGQSWFVTCTEQSFLDQMLDVGVAYEDLQGKRQIAYLDDVNEPIRTIVLKSLDPDITDEIIVEILGKFGSIQSKLPLKRELEDGVENGTRVIRMSLRENIPVKIRLINPGVEQTEFLVQYPGQLTNLKLFSHYLQ